MFRRFPVALATMMLSAALSSCGSGSAVPAKAPAPVVSPTGSPAGSITFTSDQSLVFATTGQTAKLAAIGPAGPAKFVSTNPSIAVVSPDGTVTAVGVGATTITATSGVAQDVATVSVGQVAPGSIIVPSADVLADTGNAATVLASAVPGVKVGSFIVSGDQGGLLGQVTDIQNRGATIVLTYTPISLAQAFPNADVNITGAPELATLTLAHGRATITLADGTRRTLSSTDLSCASTTSAATTIPTVTLNISEQVSIQPHLVLKNVGGVNTSFSISAILRGSVSAGYDKISVNASASAGFTCTAIDAPITLASLPYAAVRFSLTTTNEYGVSGTVGASANMTLPGLTYTYDAQGEFGLTYSVGSWSTINTKTAPGGTITLNSAQAGITGNINASFGPYFAPHIGLQATLGRRFTLASLQLLTPKIYETFDLSISGGTDFTKVGYSGPVWDGKLGLDLTFNPSIGGLAGTLLRRIGIPTSIGTFSAYNPELVVLGSPSVTTKATVDNTACTAKLEMDESDANPLKLNYNQDSVTFEALAGPNAPTAIATATAAGTDIAGSTATAPWSIMSANIGEYEIISLLYDGIFGALHLPYVSSPQLAAVMCRSAPAPTPKPTAPPTPTSASGLHSIVAVQALGASVEYCPALSATTTASAPYGIYDEYSIYLSITNPSQLNASISWTNAALNTEPYTPSDGQGIGQTYTFDSSGAQYNTRIYPSTMNGYSDGGSSWSFSNAPGYLPLANTYSWSMSNPNGYTIFGVGTPTAGSFGLGNARGIINRAINPPTLYHADITFYPGFASGGC